MRSETYRCEVRQVRSPKIMGRVCCWVVLPAALVMVGVEAGVSGTHHETAEARDAVQRTHAGAHPTAPWAEQLKGQTIVEDTLEGRPERAAMVERQHQRIMEQMERDAQAQKTGGFYNTMSMMHQYGAGGQDILLMSRTGDEPVTGFG
ncbi:MAG: hypothetical protein KatS3mg082_0109 [Nitrospiraceae bacterium]|nr:MAG: hypothetical protein KatS3mg082_0109 [Nitrospiraceae bacterium]